MARRSGRAHRSGQMNAVMVSSWSVHESANLQHAVSLLSVPGQHMVSARPARSQHMVSMHSPCGLHMISTWSVHG